MNAYTITLYLALSCTLAFSAAQKFQFGGVRATYSGTGIALQTTGNGPNTYIISIRGANAFLPNNLTIVPEIKDNTPIFFESITSDGPLNILSIRLPPGIDRANFVKNIRVNGNIRVLRLIGCDLGSSTEYEGNLSANNISLFDIRGLTFRKSKATVQQYWGGNIWADINVATISNFNMIGGSMYYSKDIGGTYGVVHARNGISKLNVRGLNVVTNLLNKSFATYGGYFNCDLFCENYPIKQIRVNGAIISSRIFAKSINSITVTSSGFTNTGIINSGIYTKDQFSNFSESSLKKLAIRDGVINDSCFAMRGHIQNVSIRLTPQYSNNFDSLINNCYFRAGFEGELFEYPPPKITPSDLSVSVSNIPSELATMFVVENPSPGSNMTIRIKQRDIAKNSFISNETGEVYHNTNFWITTENVVTGYFVWSITSEEIGKTASNILISVLGANPTWQKATLKLSVAVTNSPVQPLPVFTPEPALQAISFAAAAGSYPGRIGAISVNGNISNSMFVCGIVDNSNDWSTATYLSNIGTVKLSPNSIGNTFISGKKIKFPLGFSLINNTVWINKIPQ